MTLDLAAVLVPAALISALVGGYLGALIASAWLVRILREAHRPPARESARRSPVSAIDGRTSAGHPSEPPSAPRGAER